MFTEHENEWSGFLKETIRYKNPPILSVFRALELQTKCKQRFAKISQSGPSRAFSWFSHLDTIMTLEPSP